MRTGPVTLPVLACAAALLVCGCSDTSSVEETCGNGVVDPGEFCDGDNLGGRDCASMGYVGGTLQCDDSCNFDYALCTSAARCGDGQIEDQEECDGAELGGKTCADFGFDSGELACTTECRFDKSDCSTTLLCGNQAIDQGEECDGSELGGTTCRSLGYAGGELLCTPECDFDTGSCFSCGNGVIDDPEECDGADLAEVTCEDLGYAGGQLACTQECTFDTAACLTCGNGVIDDGEQCDGEELAGTTCVDLGFASGELGCSESCSFYTGACLACGNGVIDDDEECDGEDLGNEDCESLGFVSGELSCTLACNYDVGACLKCGNGSIEDEEECDGADLGQMTCLDLGFTGGVLGCSDSCTFETGGCYQCGNGVVEPDEECDGDDLGGEDCISLGYDGGELACTSGCAYNLDGCLDCTVPDPFQPWIQDYLMEVLGALTGETEIAPGEYLSARSSSYQRELTRTYLSDQFLAYGLEPFLQEYSSSGANVFGVLEATTDSDEWVVFGGHMDSISSSPGADDNASGTTMVMAVARYAAMLPCRDKNLMFVGFDQEESGIIGSYEFADWLDTDGYDLHSAHTADMVGWDGDGDRMVEIELPDANLFDLYDTVVTQSGLGVNLRQTSAGGTDHVSFRQFGFDAVGLCEEWTGGDSTPYYHSSGDRFSTIDFDYLELVTILANLAVVELTRLP